MELWLVDVNPELVEHWRNVFDSTEDVNIVCGDILRIAENTIVSPANSYGYMDGGIDLKYTNYFGLKFQEEIQKIIQYRQEGYLPVGAAILVQTGNKKIPYMISAPTMVVPGPVGASNAFFAMSAILNVAQKNKHVVNKLFCPGLATDVGCVPYEIAAQEMALAFRKWKNKQADI